jgi:hypothetical protein
MNGTGPFSANSQSYVCVEYFKNNFCMRSLLVYQTLILESWVDSWQTTLSESFGNVFAHLRLGHSSREARPVQMSGLRHREVPRKKERRWPSLRFSLYLLFFFFFLGVRGLFHASAHHHRKRLLGFIDFLGVCQSCLFRTIISLLSLMLVNLFSRCELVVYYLQYKKKPLEHNIRLIQGCKSDCVHRYLENEASVTRKF